MYIQILRISGLEDYSSHLTLCVRCFKLSSAWVGAMAVCSSLAFLILQHVEHYFPATATMKIRLKAQFTKHNKLPSARPNSMVCAKFPNNDQASQVPTWIGPGPPWGLLHELQYFFVPLRDSTRGWGKCECSSSPCSNDVRKGFQKIYGFLKDASI